MSLYSADFYRGILVALEIVTIHDQQVIFDEIVESVQVDELVRIARADGEMRRSGLTKYGYGKRPNTGMKTDAAIALDGGEDC